MMKDMIERSMLAEKTIQNFEQITSKYQTEISMISELKEENTKLLIKLDKMKVELEETQ